MNKYRVRLYHKLEITEYVINEVTPQKAITVAMTDLYDRCYKDGRTPSTYRIKVKELAEHTSWEKV